MKITMGVITSSHIHIGEGFPQNYHRGASYKTNFTSITPRILADFENMRLGAAVDRSCLDILTTAFLKLYTA